MFPIFKVYFQKIISLYFWKYSKVLNSDHQNTGKNNKQTFTCPAWCAKLNHIAITYDKNPWRDFGHPMTQLYGVFTVWKKIECAALRLQIYSCSPNSITITTYRAPAQLQIHPRSAVLAESKSDWSQLCSKNILLGVKELPAAA